MDKDRPGSVLSGHLPTLDGLRGLAILAVLMLHFLAPTEAGAMGPGTPHGPAEFAIARIVSYGSLGVDLFFILSGFLITGILYDSRTDPAFFRNFYMRRLLRIFPLYYGVLIVIFLLIPAIPAFRQSEFARLQDYQAWAWLYAVNIYLAIHDGWVLSYITHFWSLAVEEQFYLVWPFVVWLLAKNARHLMLVSLAVCAASMAGRVASSLLGVGPVAAYVLTPFQLDGLALGGFLAVYFRQPDRRLDARQMMLMLVGAGMALMGVQYALRHFDLSQQQLVHNAALSVRSGAFRLLLAALLLQVVYAREGSSLYRLFGSRPMVFLGTYSYGLYVYHHFISHYLVERDTVSALGDALGSRVAALLLQASVGALLSVGIAWLSFEYFEKYFLRLKRYWSPAHAPAASVHGGKAPHLAQ